MAHVVEVGAVTYPPCHYRAYHVIWVTSIHLGRGRHLPQKPIFHITVQERMNDAALKYTPKAVWPHGTEIYVQ